MDKAERINEQEKNTSVPELPIMLDMKTYARRSHFEYFKDMAFPYVGVTVNVDITEFLAGTKEKKQPFFLSFLYYLANAANSVPEFRQRILDDRIIEYGQCKTSHTVALSDGTYCYCTLDSSGSFEVYLQDAVRIQKEAAQKGSLKDGEDALSLLFVSTVPWLSYTALIQPVPHPADSNPRLTWGRYFTQEGRTLLPVSVLCHHALVDGIHITQFYKKLNELLVQK